MKVFDIHTHIYPDAIAERAAQAISHVYDDFPVLNDGRLSTLLRHMDENGIDGAAIHSVATAAKQVDNINRFILSTAHDHAGRMVPFAALHPDTPDLENKVDELVKQGFRGIKLHPEMQKFKVDEAKAVEMFAAVAGRLPVLLHCGDWRFDNSSPARIKHLLRILPNLTLICAHLGGWTIWEAAAEELIGQDIWVDCSSAVYALKPETAVNIIRGYGTDRVLFGSDYPMWNPGDEVRRLLSLPLTDDEKEDILWNNHLRLLGDNL